MAKTSLEFELNRIKKSALHSITESENQKKLESEVQRLNQVVEDLRFQNSMLFDSSQASLGSLGWSSHIARDQTLTPRMNPNSNNFIDQLNQASVSHNNNNVFVLSCAPVNDFNTVVKQELNQSNARNNDFSNVAHAPSIPEQINQFKEIQALFQPPQITPDLFPFFQPTDFSRNTHDDLAQRMHEQQVLRNKKEKLDDSIVKHKSRLHQGRNPPRRYPLNAKPSKATSSPRTRIHQVQDGMPPRSAHSANPHTVNTPGISSAYQPPQHTAIMTDGHVSRHVVHDAPSSHLLKTIDDNESLDSFEGSSYSHKQYLPQSFHHPVASHNMNNFPTTSSNISLSPESLPPQSHLHSSNARERRTPSPTTALTTPAVPISDTITVQELESSTHKLSKQIKDMVRAAVREELIEDTNNLHYTKRVQQKIISQQQKPLAAKIEKNVAAKIAAMQKELESLKDKARKIKTPKKKKKKSGDQGGDDSDDSSDDAEKKKM